eukprot:6190980-Pleurochrysis_carterae.AAC.2
MARSANKAARRSVASAGCTAARARTTQAAVQRQSPPPEQARLPWMRMGMSGSVRAKMSS